MFKITTDKKYNNIKGFGRVIETENTGIDTSLVKINVVNSIIDHPDFNTYDVSDEMAIEINKTNIMSNYNLFTYTDKDGFKIRPILTVELPDFEQPIRNSYVVPINTPIRCIVRINNPDNVELPEIGPNIKIKDRADICDFSVREFEYQKDKFEYETIISSEFPGISELRPKDTDLMCHFITTTVKFKRNI